MIYDLILRQVEKDQLELKVLVRKELERLSVSLMQRNPVERMSLEEAAEGFENLKEEGIIVYIEFMVIICSYMVIWQMIYGIWFYGNI